MLSEEALVLLTAMAGCGLLVLGVLELLWPTGDPLSHPSYRRAIVATRLALTDPPALGPIDVSRPPAPQDTRLTPAGAPTSSSPPSLEEVVAESPQALAESAIERCVALFETRSFDEVIALATPTLESDMMPAVSDSEQARLWGVLGLAKRAVGDYGGARDALANAIAIAPQPDRSIWERHLSSLALAVGRGFAARAVAPNAVGAVERIESLRAAIRWLEGGLAMAPGDTALHDVLLTAREALWPTYESAATTLIRRHDFAGARALLGEALAAADFPRERERTFQKLLTTTFSNEVGQLTADALRLIRKSRDTDAIAALVRAEEVLAMIPGDLPARRRQELERRLWWSYTELGTRRVEEGLFEEALEPLFHALGFASVGPERQEETSVPLLRALDGVVEARASMIERLIDEGDLSHVEVSRKKLRTLLRRVERAPQQELAPAFANAQPFDEHLSALA